MLLFFLHFVQFYTCTNLIVIFKWIWL